MICLLNCVLAVANEGRLRSGFSAAPLGTQRRTHSVLRAQ
jgi:hypothetical protein